MTSSRLKFAAAATLVALLAAGAYAFLQWKARTTPHHLRLADGTEAFFFGDSKVAPATGYPQPRDIAVDGDIFFRVANHPRPLTLRSRLLVLTVTGKTALRVTAYSKEAGEQVEVLDGNVKAEKSYPSPYREPDILTGGQMTMINRDIDLMEKETADLPALRSWSEALVAAASKNSR